MEATCHSLVRTWELCWQSDKLCSTEIKGGHVCAVQVISPEHKGWKKKKRKWRVRVWSPLNNIRVPFQQSVRMSRASFVLTESKKEGAQKNTFRRKTILNPGCSVGAETSSTWLSKKSSAKLKSQTRSLMDPFCVSFFRSILVCCCFLLSLFRSCVRVEVAVLGCPS